MGRVGVIGFVGVDQPGRNRVLVDFRDVDDLVGVAHEHPREARARETGGEGDPRVFLGVAHEVHVGQVGELPLEEVDAGGDGPVEEIGLGDGDLVVLGALAGLGGDGEGLAQAEEVGGLEAGVQERALQAGDPAAEGELVAVLLLHLEGDVELVLAPLARAQVGGALHGLEVAELVDALDGELQELGVEDVALVQVDLAADHLVAGGVVAREVDLAHVVALVLVHGEGDVHDLLLEVGPAASVEPVHWK